MFKALLTSLILTSLLCSAISGYSQEWTVGTRWIYEQMDYFPDQLDEYLALFVRADTLINQEKYLILDQYNLIDYHSRVDSFRTEVHYIKKVGDKVWEYSPAWDKCGLLYDFSARAGDTLQLIAFGYDWIDTLHVVIDSLVTVQFNGNSWEVQFTSQLPPIGSYFLAGINYLGIGSLSYLFPTFGAVDPPPGGRLLCFENGEVFFPTMDGCDQIVRRSNIATPFFQNLS